MLKISEMFEFSKKNSYFEWIRMVRMVRMVRSLADRTFQLWYERPLHGKGVVEAVEALLPRLAEEEERPGNCKEPDGQMHKHVHLGRELDQIGHL